jgi:AraC-like DNA-binding protein
MMRPTVSVSLRLEDMTPAMFPTMMRQVYPDFVRICLDPKVGTGMATFDDSRRDFEPYGFTCVRWTPTRMRRPDRHNEIELNLLQSGSLTYVLGGRKAIVPAGRVAAFWAAVPHQIVEARGTADYFVATIPLAWFLQCDFPEALAQPVLHGQMIFDPRNDPGDAHRFERWTEDLRTDRPQRRRAAFLEMEARLIRLALAVGERPRAQAHSANGAAGRRPSGGTRKLADERLTKVERIAAYIALNYKEPLTADDVGGHVGLHPNHAMTLFKRTFGTTVLNYITQHRISHAQRLLATTRRKILDVALDSGFGSVSRFNAVFKQACGCSPREYRARHDFGS